ncbi:Uncharacterised protein [Yersinia frederiksenii]|nr:Uncharacterised protein [Yersinia frederiksenii]CNI50380.1 Uncharacterised protein [Yersinia frederiksenii]
MLKTIYKRKVHFNGMLSIAPTVVDISCPHDKACLKASRTDIVWMTVALAPVVEHFNVIEDIRAGQIVRFVYHFLMRSFFQRIEERFG